MKKKTEQKKVRKEETRYCEECGGLFLKSKMSEKTTENKGLGELGKEIITKTFSYTCLNCYNISNTICKVNEIISNIKFKKLLLKKGKIETLKKDKDSGVTVKWSRYNDLWQDKILATLGWDGGSR